MFRLFSLSLALAAALLAPTQATPLTPFADRHAPAVKGPVVARSPLNAHPTFTYKARGIAAFPNGNIQLVWRNDDNTSADYYSYTYWTIAPSGQIVYSPKYGPYDSAHWYVGGILGAPDNSTRLIWSNNDGVDSSGNRIAAYNHISIWTIPNGGSPSYGSVYGPYDGWNNVAFSVDKNNATHLLWTNDDGRASIWTVATNGTITYSPTYGPYTHYTAIDTTSGSDGSQRILWAYDPTGNGLNSEVSLTYWTIQSNGTIAYSPSYGPYAGWNTYGIGVGGDNKTRLLWVNDDGRVSEWTLDSSNNVSYSPTFGPYDGWSLYTYAVGTDSVTHFLWTNTNGSASYWNISSTGTITYSPTYGPY